MCIAGCFTVQDFEWIRQAGLKLARGLLSDKQCVATLKSEKYDLILRDTIGWQTHLLTQMLDVPEVVRSIEACILLLAAL